MPPPPTTKGTIPATMADASRRSATQAATTPKRVTKFVPKLDAVDALEILSILKDRAPCTLEHAGFCKAPRCACYGVIVRYGPDTNHPEYEQLWDGGVPEEDTPQGVLCETLGGYYCGEHRAVHHDANCVSCSGPICAGECDAFAESGVPCDICIEATDPDRDGDEESDEDGDSSEDEAGDGEYDDEEDIESDGDEGDGDTSEEEDDDEAEDEDEDE